jgi:hypothetical protein
VEETLEDVLDRMAANLATAGHKHDLLLDEIADWLGKNAGTLIVSGTAADVYDAVAALRIATGEYGEEEEE